MKKIAIYLTILFSSAFLATCQNDSDKTSKVIIDLGAQQAVLAGNADISYSASGTVEPVPAEVTSITISAYKDGVISDDTKIAEKTFTAAEVTSGEISMEIPSGSARMFKAVAKTSLKETTAGSGTYLPPYIYTGINGPIDVEGGADVTISIALSSENLPKDANLTLNLINGAEGTDPFSIGINTAAVSSMTAEVYIPVYTGTTVSLGNPVTTVTSSTASDTSMTVTAYPSTFQIVMVKALASDGMVSYLGGTVVSTLKSGANTEPVRMLFPSQIKLMSTSSISNVRVTMQIGTAPEFDILPLSSFTSGMKFRCPSGINVFIADGATIEPGTAENRVIRVYYDSYIYTTNILPLKWGSNDITIPPQ